MFVLVKSISFRLGVWVGILNLIVSIPGLYFLLYRTYNKPKLNLTPLTAIINSGGFRGGSGGSLEHPPLWDQIISFSWRKFRKVRLI